jgi:hypothetical protein
MCHRPYPCAPVPAYSPGLPAHFHLHLVQTITIVTDIDIVATG